LKALAWWRPRIIFAPLPAARAITGRKWRSYAKALDGAPLNRAGDGPDRSRADYVWCMTAISWGFGIKETAERLMEESSKARLMEERSKGYAVLTARNARLPSGGRRQPGLRGTSGNARRSYVPRNIGY
jgi:hypothetical protein